MSALTRPPVRQTLSKELIDALMACMTKVGLREHQLPTDNEFVILVQHLIEFYGDHTDEEMKMAFDLAITGQLDLEPSQIPCYANFSSLYLSTVMNSYRRWVQARQKILIPDPVPQLTLREDTSDAGMQEWFNQVILSVINDNRDPEFLPPQLYDWLIKCGRVKETEEQQKEYLRKAIWRREAFLLYVADFKGGTESQQRLTKFIQMRTEGEFCGPEVAILQDLAKRIALKELILKRAKQQKSTVCQNQSK